MKKKLIHKSQITGISKNTSIVHKKEKQSFASSNESLKIGSALRIPKIIEDSNTLKSTIGGTKQYKSNSVIKKPPNITVLNERNEEWKKGRLNIKTRVSKESWQPESSNLETPQSSGKYKSSNSALSVPRNVSKVASSAKITIKPVQSLIIKNLEISNTAIISKQKQEQSRQPFNH